VLIRNVEIWGGTRGDVLIGNNRIKALGQLGGLPDGPSVDGNGALLLPGLHDHHLHLAALAAKQSSIRCGPPEVETAEQLEQVLARTPGVGWLRGVGYHESVMGLPTRQELDQLCPHRALRIQHRSGRLWLLNTPGLEYLLGRAAAPAGLDRATGHLFDEDAWLRTALGSVPPDLTEVGRMLAEWGVTGVTDMSPANDAASARYFAAERSAGRLPQTLVLAGSLALVGADPGVWTLGPAKLHLHEAVLPDFGAATAFVRAAHDQDRAVAIHCVTEVELVFALATLVEAGVRADDRIEHAAVASDELVDQIADLGLAVATQPQFVAERGDAYLRDVEQRHWPELYRLQAFIDAGVALAGSSDAPYVNANPWAAMAAAVSRLTATGQTLSPDEALSPEAAVELYLLDPLDLSRKRRVELGGPADLCLLDRPWSEATGDLSAVQVRGTWVSGRLIHDRIDEAPGKRGPGRQTTA